MPRRALLALACILLAACGEANAARTSVSVTVFAAASLATVMPQEFAAFESKHPGVQLHGDYEGTQALLTKLQTDASLADVFVSADRAHMDTAQRNGIVSASQSLATNALVIALPRNNPAHITSLADLARSGVKLSIADRSVPAGNYAEQSFEIAESNHDVPAGFAKQALANATTRPTDVETVVANVAAGVVDAGIVYATDAKSHSDIEAIGIAQRDQPLTEYVAAVTAKAKQAKAAQQFLDFLLSADGQRILHAAGFAQPEPTAQPLHT
jgi:molybdate transport system substrate-binding protein